MVQVTPSENINVTVSKAKKDKIIQLLIIRLVLGYGLSCTSKYSFSVKKI